MVDYKSLLNKAKTLYDDKESAATANTKDKQIKWVLTTIQSGTFTDKLSALAVLVQTVPDYPLKPLRMLLSYAKKNGVRISELAMMTIKEVYNDTLLKSDKLRVFSKSVTKNMTDIELIELYKEDGIKGIYTEYLNSVNDKLVTSLEHTKKMLTQALVDLIINHPEQEDVILTILIGRIGIEEGNLGKLCSQALRKLLAAHPNMAFIITKKLGNQITKSDTIGKSTLRCVKIISSISSYSKNKETKDYVFKLFHNMFKTITSLNSKKPQTKILNYIITGVQNTMDGQTLEESTQDIYRVAYTANLKTRVDCLQLIFAMCKSKKEFPKKYYNCIYEIFKSSDLHKSSSLDTLFQLIYSSLKEDTVIDRIISIIKRLLQRALISGTDFIVASLILLSKIAQSNKLLHQWILTKQSELSEEEKFVDADAKPTQEKEEENQKKYNSEKRDCEFTNAYDENLWELEALARHQHPRVRRLVQSIIEGTFEKYTGNPLMDFKDINFLDKISYKNPKKLKRFFKGRSSNIETPMNLAKVEDLNTDESMVFYKYFTTKQKLKKPAKAKEVAKVVEKEQTVNENDENDENFGENDDGADEFLRGEIKKKKMYDGT